MAAPEYVPRPPTETVRSYGSPDHVPPHWMATRPGDIVDTGQPRGAAFGYQGPDLGYVLTLVHRFDDRLRLTPGEHRDDVDAGCATVAMKRSSLFGRAPVIHDLEIAYRVWGYLDDAPDELVELRTRVFEGVADAHHYAELRTLVAAVPEATLRRTPEQVAQAYDDGWASLLEL